MKRWSKLQRDLYNMGTIRNGCAKEDEIPTSAQGDGNSSAIVVGDIIPFGAFGGKALYWSVLDAQRGRVLLPTADIIEKRSYHSSHTDVTWEECALRRYLNGDFLTNFGTDKSRIAQVTNANPNNQWFGTAGGDSRTDKVFLLSIDEVVKYFEDGDLKNRQCNSKRIAKYENEAWWWWLRSPGDIRHCAACVRTDGDLNINGYRVLVQRF